ncbi:hypothetical protein QQZ08_002782 [Neonectria magnoliae]|uniref:Uncharacterized protein n=1 Tax=Neonectria magnoliae TaxID=2732573 RepID=A0ABR1IAV3_9HYPO
MASYALRNAVGLVGPKKIRMVCIPAVFWEKMVADVRDELAGSAAPNEDPLSPRAMFSWSTAQNSMSLHKVLRDDLISPSDRSFISMALGFPTVLPAGDILTKPLSWLAMQFRRATNEQGTRAQVESYAALQREFSATVRMPIFFGDTGMYNLFYSNWQKAALFYYDFG